MEHTGNEKHFSAKQMEKHCSDHQVQVWEQVFHDIVSTARMVHNRILRHRLPGACTEFLKMQDF